ncbi:MAG: hypothetical protein CL916_07045 [Deltaproteobacteria bacterium]|nr:hypothetical protein [Deltaproteobacteria bacterium]
MSNDERGNYAAGTGEIIAGLPKVIVNHPALIWGYDPCENNTICRLGLGPSDQKVTGVRKGYPQYKRDPKRFLFGEEDSWSFMDFEELSTFSISTEEFIDLAQRAGLPSTSLPRTYCPNSPNRLRIKAPKEWSEIDILNLDTYTELMFHGDFLSQINNIYLQCKDKLQEQLIQKGMPLWSDQPDKSFSFHPTTGEIEICHGERFVPMHKQESSTYAPSTQTIVNWDGLNLRGLHIKSASLRNTSMVRTLLQGANITSANLEGSVLREANLGIFKGDFRTELTEANVSGADLTEINLTEASLIQANLSKSNLTFANLSGADLTRANLTESNLTNAIILEGESGYRAILDEADCTNANLTRVNCQKATMSETILVDATLNFANLSGVEGAINFCGAKLCDANLQDANLECSDFTNADLQRTNLCNSILSCAIFQNAKLDKAILKGADLSFAELSGASLQDVDLSTTNLNQATYDASTVWPVGFSPQEAKATLNTEE